MKQYMTCSAVAYTASAGHAPITRQRPFCIMRIGHQGTEGVSARLELLHRGDGFDFCVSTLAPIVSITTFFLIGTLAS